MTSAIRALAVAVTLGAFGVVMMIHTPGVVTFRENWAVQVIGSASLAAVFGAGWASRGVKVLAVSDEEEGPHRPSLD